MKIIKTIKNNPGDSTSVFMVDIDGQQCLLKRYNADNFFQRIKSLFRGSRAKRAAKFSDRLLALGIPTPKVIEIKNSRVGPSHIVYEYLEGECCANLFFQPEDENWRLVVERILAITSQLADAKLSHNDYHCGNFLIVDGYPILVDLDHMRQHWFHYTANRAHKKDIKHFEGYLGDKPVAKGLYFSAKSSLVY